MEQRKIYHHFEYKQLTRSSRNLIITMGEVDEGAAFRSTLQFVQSTMLNNDRYEELERRLVEQSRKAARERTEIERRHYEQQQVRDAQMSQQVTKYKKKESELKKILRERENELSSISRDAKKYRRKFSEAQSELEATRSYAQQLVSFHVPENINTGNVGGSNDDDRIHFKIQEASSLTSAANEILRLRDEMNALKGNLSVQKTQLEGEKEIRNNLQKDHHIQHIKILELSEMNRKLEMETIQMKASEEKDKEVIIGLETQVTNLQDMLAKVQPLCQSFFLR